jgi:HAD superfamily hydrolase (TIGR01490 family)
MSSDPAAVAAFFDVDGTLTRTTVLHPLVWYQKARLPRLQYAAWLAGLCLDLPRYILIDQRDRAAFNRLFYRRYAGLRAEDIRQFHHQAFERTLKPRLFPSAIEKVAWHRGQGHRIILISGGIGLTLQPLAEFLQADELICVQLEEKEGVLTGNLATPAMVEIEKAAAIRHCTGIDLASSYAYGDSKSDAPMLECVGHPVTVNPDRRLRALARQRGWPVLEWSRT